MSATVLRVWAPHAEQVEAVLSDGREPMRPEEDGWWILDRELPPGTDYAFSLDGGEPLPDPRSPWQPSGIDGTSRTVDHDAFAWTDAAWRGPPLGSGSIYELHIGTFTADGTFDAAIERLPELADLGVTHLELMPIVEFAGDHGWGYDGVDLYAPHHAYGGPDGLKRFVDTAHRLGLAVMLDVVYNHLGPAGNHLQRFGPYFTNRYITPWGDAVNFDDRGAEEVRRFVADNALMWLRDYHLDGLRLDAVHAIFDSSALHILEQLAREIDRLELQLGRPLILTAESDRNDPRLVLSTDAGGFGMDAAWNDDFHHALQGLLTGEQDGYYADFGEMHQLAETLEHAWVYRGDYSRERERRHGREPIGLPGDRFIGFVQNHDQVGNRARGERIGELAGLQRAKIAAAVVFAAPFVPLVFQGEEWAASTPFLYFTDHRDPELGEAVRRGRRDEFARFGWDPEQIPDPQDPGTFTASVLQWDERKAADHAEMLAWYRELTSLRRTTPQLLDPRLSRVTCRFDEERGWFVMERGAIGLAFNVADGAQELDLPGTLLLASEPGVTCTAGVLTLPPGSVAFTELAP